MRLQTCLQRLSGEPGKPLSNCCESGGSQPGTTSAMAAWSPLCWRWPLQATVAYRYGSVKFMDDANLLRKAMMMVQQ